MRVLRASKNSLLHQNNEKTKKMNRALEINRRLAASQGVSTIQERLLDLRKNRALWYLTGLTPMPPAQLRAFSLWLQASPACSHRETAEQLQEGAGQGWAS